MLAWVIHVPGNTFLQVLLHIAWALLLAQHKAWAAASWSHYLGLKSSRLAACRIAAAETVSPTSSPPLPLQHTLCIKQAAIWRWVLTPSGCSSPVRRSGTFLSSMGVCVSECENCLLRSFSVCGGKDMYSYCILHQLPLPGNVIMVHIWGGSISNKHFSFTKEEFILALEISEIKITERCFWKLSHIFALGLPREGLHVPWMRKFEWESLLAFYSKHQVLLTVKQRERYPWTCLFSCSAFHQKE